MKPGARAQAVVIAEALVSKFCMDTKDSPYTVIECDDAEELASLIAQAIQAAVKEERERIAKKLDAEADRQEADWKAWLKNPANRMKHATSFHTIPRGYAASIRQEGDLS